MCDRSSCLKPAENKHQLLQVRGTFGEDSNLEAHGGSCHYDARLPYGNFLELQQRNIQHTKEIEFQGIPILILLLLSESYLMILAMAL